MPDRRIEWSEYGIGALDDERDGAAGGLIAVLHPLICEACHPFLDPVAVHSIEPSERVTAKRSAPIHRYPNVGAENGAVNSRHGIARGWHIEAAERRPQQGAWRNELSCHAGSWNLERVADEDGCPAPKAT